MRSGCSRIFPTLWISQALRQWLVFRFINFNPSGYYNSKRVRLGTQSITFCQGHCSDEQAAEWWGSDSSYVRQVPKCAGSSTLIQSHSKTQFEMLPLTCLLICNPSPQNIQFFLSDNQGGEDVTQVSWGYFVQPKTKSSRQPSKKIKTQFVMNPLI